MNTCPLWHAIIGNDRISLRGTGHMGQCCGKYGTYTAVIVHLYYDNEKLC